MSGQRTSARSLAEIARRLTERDTQVLHLLADTRLATASQIERLVFTEGSPLTRARRTRRCLARLHDFGLLGRLERRIGGVRAGSAGFVYRLAAPAKRLLGCASTGWREPTFAFVDHTLAIVDLRVALEEAAHEGHIEALSVTHEPEAWRRFTGPHGERSVLRPDLFVQYATADLEHLWFIEIDRDTEHRPAIATKCHQYLAYLRSGIEQHRTGVFPQVLWSVPSQRRADHLSDLIQGLPEPATDLFVVATTNTTLATLIGETTPKGGDS